MPWGIKQDFPSQGVLGRMVGWWLQSFLKLSMLSLMWDLTWDWTSAWQICPDQRETSECLTMVSIKQGSFFLFVCLLWVFICPCLPPFVLALFFFSVWWKKGKIGDGGASFCQSQRLVLLLSVSISHLIKCLPVWVEVHLRIEKGDFFFFSKLVTPCFPIYLSGLNWDRNEGLIDGNDCF